MTSIPPNEAATDHLAPRGPRDDRRDVVALAAAPGTGDRRSDDRRQRRRGEVLVALARAVRPGSRRGRQLSGHLVGDRERPVEERRCPAAATRRRSCGRDRIFLTTAYDSGRRVSVLAFRRADGRSSGKPSHRPGGADRRTTRTVTPRRHRPPTASACTCRSAPGDCGRRSERRHRLAAGHRADGRVPRDRGFAAAVPGSAHPLPGSVLGLVHRRVRRAHRAARCGGPAATPASAGARRSRSAPAITTRSS